MSQEQQGAPNAGDPGIAVGAVPSTAPSAPDAVPKPASFISTITSTLAASLPTGNYPPTLDTILAQITGTSNALQSLHALSNTLRHGLPKESRDAILAGILPGGQDPLGALDVGHDTLGVLWILCVRSICGTLT